MADRSRIAVVLIHGMGEPRPMGTIRSFVDAIANRETPPTRSWSKPLDDPLLYDIRRIVMAGSRTRPVVDFYEFYWAHLMQGNKLAQLLRWGKDLVFRGLGRVPKHLRSIYWAGWGLIAFLALTAVLTIVTWFFQGTLPFWWPIATGIVTFIYGLCSYFLLGTLADAARYLDTRPDNVQARFEIQKAGVNFLKRLHTGGAYNRVIVVGHSLGAMIGYDVLRQAWLPFAVTFDPVETRKVGAIDKLRFAVRDWPEKPVSIPEYRALQDNAWAEHIGNGGSWRVTNFITLGAPLAHAELLMAEDPADYARRTAGRELSTCPPTWDSTFGITRDIKVKSLGDGKEPSVRSPDHAGVFALTKWTNIYSPPAFLFVGGDFLSGPVAPVFGEGITDISVKAGHTTYWPGEAVPHLIDAMDLTGRNAAYAPAAGEASTPPE